MPDANTVKKLTLLGSLYLAQGLPDGFFRQTLPVMLRREGVSLEGIGLATLLMLPWGLKFLWAPLVDRHGSPRFGRRRSWIVPLQVTAIATMLLLAQAEPQRGLAPLLCGVLLINFVAATQDIAADGLAVALLRPEERGLGNGVQVAAYRLGMILSGGVLIVLFEQIGWSGCFYWMAGVSALAMLPVLATREPAAPPPERDVGLLAGFLRQPGIGGWLLTIAAFKFGEAFATAMLRPMFVDRGISLVALGWITGTAGFIAGLVGAMVGGVFVGAYGRHRMLIIFGALQAVAVASYALLALGPLDLTRVYVICIFEHLVSGMATAALFTMMMDATRPHAAGTDYTAQASVVVLATGIASAFSGFSAQALGYAGHFAVASSLCLAATGLVVVHRDRVRRGTALVAVLP
ncbi:MAG: MFS transporter [Nannocystis sp.]|nr:MFS transporter [Nannocystis sp.]MBA3546990.1 MFS transporter [Nannocystis sp.]